MHACDYVNIKLSHTQSKSSEVTQISNLDPDCQIIIQINPLQGGMLMSL